MTHSNCFKKVSVQFLPTDTNWKGGTLEFIGLRLGGDYSTVLPTYGCIFFLLSLTGGLIGCVHSLKIPVSFEVVGWNITYDFVYFSDLEQLAA